MVAEAGAWQMGRPVMPCSWPGLGPVEPRLSVDARGELEAEWGWVGEGPHGQLELPKLCSGWQREVFSPVPGVRPLF